MTRRTGGVRIYIYIWSYSPQKRLHGLQQVLLNDFVLHLHFSIFSISRIHGFAGYNPVILKVMEKSPEPTWIKYQSFLPSVLFSERVVLYWFGGIRPGCSCKKHHPEMIGRAYPPVIKGQHMLKSINSLDQRRSRITITASMFNVSRRRTP